MVQICAAATPAFYNRFMKVFPNVQVSIFLFNQHLAKKYFDEQLEFGHFGAVFVFK